MAQTIKIKRSGTSGNKLTGSNSIAGEIGMNTADKSLYIQTGSTDASVVTVYDDSILHLDDTNNRVGINTTSPAVSLHVEGFARFTDIQLSGATPQINAIANTSLVIKTNNTEQMRIDADGRLLVNTTSSIDNFAKIQVVGDSSSIARITLQDVDGTNKKTYFEQSGGGTRINTQNGTSNGFFTIGAWDGTTSSDFLRVHSNGQLGIGVTDFTNALRGSGKQLIIGSCFFGTGAALVADDFARFGGALYIHEDAGTNKANLTSIDNNGVRLVITGKGGTTNNALDAPDGFYVGGTQFITSSRAITNVTNITATGTITSSTGTVGASPNTFKIITSTEANTAQGDVYAALEFHVTGAENSTGTLSDSAISAIKAIDYRSGTTSFDDAGLGFYTLESSDSAPVFRGGFANAGGLFLSVDGNVDRNTGAGDLYADSNIEAANNLTFNNQFKKGSNVIINNSSELLINTVNITDGDFVVLDNNNTSELNIIWRDHSADRLYLGTTTDIVEFRGNVNFQSGHTLSHNGNVVLDASRNLTNIGTINTGQGATEVYLMNQNVRTTDSPTFGGLTVNGNIDLNGSNINDINQINGTAASGWLDFNMDTDSVYPQSTSDNQTVLGSVTHMNFVGDSNGNGVGGSFYWGYGVDNADSGTFTETLSLNRTGAVTFNQAFTFPTTDGSANQVLKTDGSGNVTWATEAAVSGNTSISDADGDTKIQVEESADDDTIRFDTAGTERMIIDETGKVGIGTTSPTNQLHVASGQIMVGSNTGAGVHINSTGSLEICRTAGSADPFIDFKDDATQDYDVRLQMDDGHFKITNTAGERVRVESGGNVGIGTTSPTAKLDVLGNVKVASTNNPAKIFFRDSRASSNSEISQRSDGRLSLAAVAGSYATTGIEILANGNVGIGTTPNSKLDVLIPNLSGGNNGNGITVADDGAQLKLEVRKGTGGVNANRRISLYEDGGNFPLYLQEEGGNVGIGIAAAGTVNAKLEVNLISSSASSLMNANTVNDVQLIRAPFSSTAATTSNAGAKWGLRFVGRNDSNYDNLKSGAIYAVSEDSGAGYNRNVGLAFHTSGFDSNHSERLRITNTGNVGIGTTAPAQKLHVEGGNGQISSTGFTALNINSTRTSGNVGGMNFTASDVLKGQIFGSVEGHLKFAINGSTEAVRITSAGNVGIGTTSPASNLHVKTSVDNSVSQGIVVERSLNSDRGYINYNGGAFQFRSTVGDPIVFGETDAEHLRILPDGNMGMGTTSVSSALSGSNRTFKIEDADGADIRFVHTGGVDFTVGVTNSNTSYIWNAGSHNILFGTAATERMRIASGGQLLVGTPSYGYAGVDITVGSTSDSQNGIGIQTSTTGYGYILFGDGTGSDSYRGQIYYKHGDDFLSIQTAGSERMRIDSSGRVGIGTSSPTDKLDVAGALRLTANISFDSNKAGRIYKASNHGLAFHGVTGTENDFAMFTPAGQLMVVNPTGTNNVSLIPAATGNVGIGTTNPSLKLVVDSGSVNHVAQFKSTDNSALISIADNDTTVYVSAENARGSFGFYTGTNTSNLNITSNGNVGIGTNNLNAKLNVEELGIDTTTTSTTATTQVAIDTFGAATFRSARYTIQVTNSTDSTYHITEILLIHDGTTPAITEFGTIFTGSAEATFDADISSGNVRLLATPATTDSMTFKVVRHCITV